MWSVVLSRKKNERLSLIEVDGQFLSFTVWTKLVTPLVKSSVSWPISLCGYETCMEVEKSKKSQSGDERGRIQATIQCGLNAKATCRWHACLSKKAGWISGEEGRSSANSGYKLPLIIQENGEKALQVILSSIHCGQIILCETKLFVPDLVSQILLQYTSIQISWKRNNILAMTCRHTNKVPMRKFYSQAPPQKRPYPLKLST